MKYYKLLTDNEFIGIIDSTNFKSINSHNGWLLTSDEIHGQFVSYNNKLYRDYWMQPIPKETKPFTIIHINEITKEEYDSIKEAINNNEEIIIIDEDEEEPIEENEPILEEPDITVEYVRAAKIKEMSRTCNHIIEAGFDVEIQNQIHHFSLTVQDQLNLITLSSMAAQGSNQIPYHADGELCKFYTAAEINLIVNQATMFKTYHTTYYNALKAYINSLDTIEEISAITYGTELPEEFQTDVLRAITQ